MADFTKAISAMKSLMVSSSLHEKCDIDFTEKIVSDTPLKNRIFIINRDGLEDKLDIIEYERSFDNKRVKARIIKVSNKIISVIPVDDLFEENSIINIHISKLDIEELAYLMDNLLF